MTSARYEFWNDSGYTESGVERPPIGSTLSNPDFTYTQERPNKDDMFSKVSVKGDYVSLMNVSYLRVTYDFNESDPIVLYGWVDSVSLRSDTEDYPMTDIYWHVDLWRTYASKARFMAGTVRRRPLTSEVPPQPYPYRFVRTTDPIHSFCGETVEGADLWWCFVNYVKDSDLTAYDTYLATICFPVIRSPGGGVIALRYIRTPNKVEVAPTMADITSGLLEERMMIDPQSIISVSLSPLAPCSYTGTGTQADPFELDDDRDWIGVLNQDGNYAWFRNFGGTRTGMYEVFGSALSRAVMTNDTVEYIIQDLFGATVGRLPWGLSVRNYTIRVVNVITSFYIQIRFDGTRSQPEGLTFNVPLPMISVTGNSWSSYVYSGQREYDINMRNAQSQQALIKDTISAVTGAGEQAGLATMFGGSNTEKGGRMMKGGSITAIAHAVGSTAGFLSDYYYFNNEFQKWEDYSASHQTDNIILPGDGFDFLFNGTHICLSSLNKDAYSVAQRNSDISMYGAHVTEPMQSCQALVNAGGPLQITNMTVRGDIPVEAKEYIRAMFSNGVRLI